MSLIPEKKKHDTVPPFDELTILIYGIQGTGKTTFCNGDHNCITAAVEPGSDFCNTRPVTIQSWQVMYDVLHEMTAQLKNDPQWCSALVIDTVELLAEYCRDDVCLGLGIAYPGEKKDFGRSWSAITKEWSRLISYAMHLTNVRFISHSRETQTEIINDDGLTETITQQTPRFSTGQPALLLAGWVSLVGYTYLNRKGQFCITFKGNAYRCAKDRTNVLSDVDEIVLHDRDNAFDHVKNLYIKKATEKNMKVVNKLGEVLN